MPPILQKGGIKIPSMHPSAAKYMAALMAAGAVPTGTQMAALSTFFQTGDIEGWRSALACLYLPVWGAALPNALDAVTLTSGTFVGSVVHTSKQFQGSGATPGYFNTNCTPAALGLGIQSCGVAIGYPVTPSGYNIDSGARVTTAAIDDLILYYNGTYIALNLGNTFVQGPFTTRPGIMHFNSNSTAVTFGFSDTTQQTGTFGITGTGSLPTVPLYVGAFNNAGVALGQTGRAIMTYAAWRSITQAQANALATALYKLITVLRA